MKKELARVVDPTALATASGSRGRVRVEIPRGSALRGAELTITVPRRVTCARCDGGGCDACGRTGALAVPLPDAERKILLRVPAGPPEAIAVRLADPFPGVPIDQLLVEITPGEIASEGVEVSPPLRAASRIAPPLVPRAVMIGAAIAAVIAIVVELVRH